MGMAKCMGAFVTVIKNPKMADHDPAANDFDPVWDSCFPPPPHCSSLSSYCPWLLLIQRKVSSNMYTIILFDTQSILLQSTRNYVLDLSETPSSLRCELSATS